MAKRKNPKIPRKKIIKTEVPETKFQRWRIVENTNNRVIFIDFRCIRSVPYKPVDYGIRRYKKWNSPQQLQGLIDEYFASCFGPMFNYKTGEPYMNPDGTLRIMQIKPYTLSGLAIYIHIDRSAITNYSKQQIDDLGMPTDEDYCGPQYSEILIEARKRIEAYAEERLYDRDGYNGGKFVLNASFGWQDQLEKATIENMRAQNMFRAQELQLKKEALMGDNDGNEPVTIQIVRAKKEVDDE